MRQDCFVHSHIQRCDESTRIIKTWSISAKFNCTSYRSGGGPITFTASWLKTQRAHQKLYSVTYPEATQELSAQQPVKLAREAIANYIPWPTPGEQSEKDNSESMLPAPPPGKKKKQAVTITFYFSKISSLEVPPMACNSYPLAGQKSQQPFPTEKCTQLVQLEWNYLCNNTESEVSIQETKPFMISAKALLGSSPLQQAFEVIGQGIGSFWGWIYLCRNQQGRRRSQAPLKPWHDAQLMSWIFLRTNSTSSLSFFFFFFFSQW